MAAWLSCPHIWPQPLTDRNSRSLSSRMGRASISARRRIQGSPFPITAEMPVSFSMRGNPAFTKSSVIFSGRLPPQSLQGIPSSSNFFLMYALVCGRSVPISGIWCRYLRSARICSRISSALRRISSADIVMLLPPVCPVFVLRAAGCGGVCASCPLFRQAAGFPEKKKLRPFRSTDL